MSAPFAVFGLPRSRSYWLANFLAHRPYAVAHDHARFIRSVDDVRSWLSQPYVGSVETAAAPWWRLARSLRPDLRIAVVRRDPSEVLASLMRIGGFDRDATMKVLLRQDRALDRIEDASGCMSVAYDDLEQEVTCARLFEHCLQIPHSHERWAALAPVNMQCDLTAIIRYTNAHWPQIASTAKKCADAARYVSLRRSIAEPDADGCVVQEEAFPAFWQDAQAAISEHSVGLGHSADHALGLNVPLFRTLSFEDKGIIVTTRLNGRILGYITACVGPSMRAPNAVDFVQMSLFVAKDAGGMNLRRRMQHVMLERARAKGASKAYFRAGILGDGPRFGTLYKRMGAREFGQLYELDLAG
jgi:L-amino acid N-acyltransferase YncA